MDITVINDYTRDGMLKCCDEVIDMINKIFVIQEVDKKKPKRKSGNDLLEELELARIEEGASQVENCELFKSKTVEDFEEIGR